MHCTDVKSFLSLSKAMQKLYFFLEKPHERKKFGLAELDRFLCRTFAVDIKLSQPGSDEETTKTKIKFLKEIMSNLYKNSSEEIYLTVIWLFYWDNTVMGAWPVFQVFEGSSGSACTFITDSLTCFHSWSDLMEFDNFSGFLLSFPHDGIYSIDENEQFNMGLVRKLSNSPNKANNIPLRDMVLLPICCRDINDMYPGFLSSAELIETFCSRELFKDEEQGNWENSEMKLEVKKKMSNLHKGNSSYEQNEIATIKNLANKLFEEIDMEKVFMFCAMIIEKLTSGRIKKVCEIILTLLKLAYQAYKAIETKKMNNSLLVG